MLMGDRAEIHHLDSCAARVRSRGAIFNLAADSTGAGLNCGRR